MSLVPFGEPIELEEDDESIYEFEFDTVADSICWWLFFLLKNFVVLFAKFVIKPTLLLPLLLICERGGVVCWFWWYEDDVDDDVEEDVDLGRVKEANEDIFESKYDVDADLVVVLLFGL